MSNPKVVTNLIPDDITCQDNQDNKLQAFLAALKDILDTKSGMFFIDKESIISACNKREKKLDEDVEKIKGVRFKVISKT